MFDVSLQRRLRKAVARYTHVRNGREMVLTYTKAQYDS